jgi:hypothetical protein
MALNDIYPSVYINIHGLDEFKKQNPAVVVEEDIAYYKINPYSVIRLSYYDGKQDGNGTSLHYRGDHLIKDTTSNELLPLRVSLPVSPETSQLRKFKSHAELYPYVSPIKKYLTAEFSEPTVVVEGSRYNRCFVLPKVDGSLMNVSIVKAESVQGVYIKALAQKHGLADRGEFYKEIDDRIYFIGTKLCLFASQASTVIEPFKSAVLASYGSFGAFYGSIDSYVDTLSWTETATVVFEAVPDHPYSGLTVDYGRNFLSHIATVCYKEGKVGIQLPDAVSVSYLEGGGVTPVEIPCSGDALEAYYGKKMEEALKGLVVDLEGFMLAFTEPGGGLLYMKLKFPWYYVAHKPEMYQAEAERIYGDESYALIKDRLYSLKVAVSVAAVKKNPRAVLEEFGRLFIKSFEEVYIAGEPRKDTMVRLFALAAIPYQAELDSAFKGILAKLYMKMELNLKNHMAALYGVLIGGGMEKKLDAVVAFYVKVLKL